MTNPAPKESVRILLSEIVDYAGLFPPSKLSMSEAVANYAAYKNGKYAWMLGRFVVPVSRLGEFYTRARGFLQNLENNDEKGVWRLSILTGKEINETVRIAEDFNANNSSGVVCDSLEVKAFSQEEIVMISNAVPDTFTVYFELPLTDNLPDLVSTLARKKQGAKIRMGGVTPDLFPKTIDIIRFIKTCLEANVPFKATAGLHHPIRCFKSLTYEPNAPKGNMCGFLNLFLGTGFAREGFRSETLEQILEEEAKGAFDFKESGAQWQRKHHLNNHQLANLREKSIISFGSCSFEEPIEDLQEIGLL